MRFRPRQSEDADVPMSPLIDCVFLLLIFFLVTSMIKRFERQIPVTLADPTAAVSVESDEDVFLMGIDTAGRVYAENGKNQYGVVKFAPVGETAAYLQELAGKRGTDKPIELVVERKTPFQLVIDTLDVFELQGFDNVRSRVRAGPVGGR